MHTRTFRRASVVLGLTLAASCHQVPFVASPNSQMRLFANPMFIPANGGVSEITAVVYDGTGSPAPDGTVVQFFTSLGHIDEQGKTNDGVARVNLVADARSGTAEVRAISGPVTAPTVSVDVGGVLPADVIVTANPSRITDSRSTHVSALVIDKFGNPVANIPVVFRVETNIATEEMESGGAPRYTDNNGRAEDVMRTRRPHGSSAGSRPAEVSATLIAGDDISNSVLIPIE